MQRAQPKRRPQQRNPRRQHPRRRIRRTRRTASEACSAGPASQSTIASIVSCCGRSASGRSTISPMGRSRGSKPSIGSRSVTVIKGSSRRKCLSGAAIRELYPDLEPARAAPAQCGRYALFANRSISAIAAAGARTLPTWTWPFLKGPGADASVAPPGRQLSRSHRRRLVDELDGIGTPSQVHGKLGEANHHLNGVWMVGTENPGRSCMESARGARGNPTFRRSVRVRSRIRPHMTVSPSRTFVGRRRSKAELSFLQASLQNLTSGGS